MPESDSVGARPLKTLLYPASLIGLATLVCVAIIEIGIEWFETDADKGALRLGAIALTTLCAGVAGYWSLRYVAGRHKRTEADLARSERDIAKHLHTLEKLVSGVGGGVVIADTDGKFLRFNEAARLILGIGQTERPPNEWSAHYGMFRPDMVTRILPGESPLERAMRGETVAEREVFIRNDQRPDGVWCIVMAAPLQDDVLRGGIAVFRDITKRKIAEEALRREHEMSESIINTAQNIVLVLDVESRIMQLNPYMEELTGWRRDEVEGRDWCNTFIPERDRERIRSLFGQALTGERTHGNVNPIVTKDGREREIEWFDAPLTNSKGERIGLLCTGQDITERKRAEEKLHASEFRLQAIVETAAEAIVTIDRRGIVQTFNRAAANMFGYATDEVIGGNVSVLMPSPDRERHDDFIKRYIETGEARIIGIGQEVLGLRRDGSTFPLHIAVNEIDHLGLFTGVLRDLTETKELHREVLSVAEKERERIGEDLHDGIGQELTGLGLTVDSLAQKLEQANVASGQEQADVQGLRQTVDRIAESIRESRGQLRQLVKGLVPIPVGAGHLSKALKSLAATVDVSDDISCLADVDEADDLRDATVTVNVYRIAQESINNALKHSQADKIHVTLKTDNGTYVLEIADNGVGFDPGSVALKKNAGLGLRIMEHRSRLVGATLAIEPGAEGGTTVRCTFHDAETENYPPPSGQ